MELYLILLIAGAVLAVAGFVLLKGYGNHTPAAIIFGILLMACGGGCAFVGYDTMQNVEKIYTVTETQTVNTDNTKYRVTLTDENGGITWIYVSSDEMYKFEKDSKVTYSNNQLKQYEG